MAPGTAPEPSEGGGQVPLGDERLLFAEPLPYEEAYLVRGEPEVGAHGRRATALSLNFLGRGSAEAEFSGRRLRLRLRHSEILTLLRGVRMA